MSYAQAIRRATATLMATNPKVFVVGQGIAGGIYETVPLERPERLIESPLSEDAMTGFCVGAAQAGMLPIQVHIRMDFLLLCMNQIVNMAAKTRDMYGDQWPCPVIIRAIVGRSWGQGAQHSQALHALFMHIPGINVFAPVTPQDAYDCMMRAAASPIPTIIMEHRLLHKVEGEVNVAGGADAAVNDDADVTVVAVSHAYVEAVRAKQILEAKGIGVDLQRVVALAPLGLLATVTSVELSRALLVVDNGWLPCGAAAEIIASVVERVPGVSVARLGFAHRACPPTRDGEQEFYPSSARIASAAWELVTGEAGVFPEVPLDIDFRGPF